ncbi:vacuolar protein-sorting-associated protein 36-like [Bactrocera tryoni]|uniref:vacuolar protein-sorting-associated protein 36-like n=1 Tax=Bactrocera tryoni TaxID=59916 RepID=UPI001A974BAC|nr:vacuolar protein-sorting-associated protein 36-like [Bactrocera tryoni]
MQFTYNLLLLFLLLFCISSVDAANAIKCRQQETVMRAKRQTVDLSLQQQYQQRQRNSHEQLSPQTSSVVKPVVKFFVATPGQQVQQLQANSGAQQRIAFTSQQQQQQHLQQFRPQQQQQQTSLVPSSSLTQLANGQQYLQSNSYMQRRPQQQQVDYITNFPRISQQAQQQQQQFQTQPPQQFQQSQQQPLQFYKPQITTKNRIQYNNFNQQPTSSSYPPQTPTQRQQESTPTPNQGNDAVGPVLTPLLPSYSDEDDTPLNYTRPCEMCCTPGQTPCQNCCDTNPLLSVAVLKSSAG